MAQMIGHVLTITLNPTVDKNCTVQRVQPDKKLRCSQPTYEPGGGGINVARGLVRLGIPVRALFPSGGRTGALLESLLHKENVDIIPIPVTGETRENFSVLDESSNRQYRFGMPGEPLVPVEAEAITERIAALEPFPKWVITSGSLPPEMEPTYLVKLIKMIKLRQAHIILDTSGEALKTAVAEGVFLIKPNLGELSSLVGIEALDNPSAERAAKQLITEGKAAAVAVSLGAQGAYLVTSEDSFYVHAPTVKKRSTVGAGDSMVAGMVAQLARGGAWPQVARMGVACGSAATMNPGTALFNKEDAEKLYHWLAQTQ